MQYIIIVSYRSVNSSLFREVGLVMYEEVGCEEMDWLSSASIKEVLAELGISEEEFRKAWGN